MLLFTRRLALDPDNGSDNVAGVVDASCTVVVQSSPVGQRASLSAGDCRKIGTLISKATL